MLEDLHIASLDNLAVPRPNVDDHFISNLPPELLSRIFEVGSADDVDAETEKGSGDEGDEINSNANANGGDSNSDVSSTSSPRRVPFPILVSHVCRRWRTIALSTPSLWTTVDVSIETRSPYERISTLLERSKGLLIDICCDLVFDDISDAECLDHVKHIFSMLALHIHRWRTVEVFVLDHRHMNSFLSAVSYPSVTGAPRLATLELYSSDMDNHGGFNPSSSQNTLLGGFASLLTRLVLWGVHVDWSLPWIASAPNLKQLELAYHGESVRPSWAQFASILRSATSLEKLILRQSGPSGDPTDWFIEPTEENPADLNARVQLFRVTDFTLALHSQVYAVALLRKLDLPALKYLGLEFHIGDYAHLVRELAGQATPLSPTQEQPSSLLSRLEGLAVLGLPCQSRSIRTLFSELRNLASLELSLSWNLTTLFLDVLCTLYESSGRGDVWLPRLVTLRVSMVSGKIMRKLVEKRRDVGLPLDSLYVRTLYDAKEGDVEWLKENVKTFELFELF